MFGDEPTGNLDSKTSSEILSFMQRAVKELQQTIVMVTHDPTSASYADRVLFLADGELVHEMFDPTPDEWRRYASDNRDDTADAYFLSCAATRATDVIADIEADLGKPVLTSNSATLWHSLRLAGVEPAIDGFGMLLAGRTLAAQPALGAA